MSVHDRGSHITAGFGFVHPREVLESPPGESGLPDDSLIVLRDTFQEPVLTNLAYHRADTGQRYYDGSGSAGCQAFNGRLTYDERRSPGGASPAIQMPFGTTRAYAEIDVYPESLGNENTSRQHGFVIEFTVITQWFGLDAGTISGPTEESSSQAVLRYYLTYSSVAAIGGGFNLVTFARLQSAFPGAPAEIQLLFEIGGGPYRIRAEVTATDQVFYVDGVELLRRPIGQPNLRVNDFYFGFHLSTSGAAAPRVATYGNLEVGRNF